MPEKCNYLFERKNVKYCTRPFFRRTYYCQYHVQLAEEVLFVKCLLRPLLKFFFLLKLLKKLLYVLLFKKNKANPSSLDETSIKGVIKLQ